MITHALDSYWAVGEGILRRRGDRWEEVLPRPGPAGILTAGYSASPSDAWLVGHLDTRRWDGRAWTPVLSLKGERLAAVWGRGAGEVWMGGEKLFRWDGQQTSNVVDAVFSNVKVLRIWGPPTGSEVWLLTSSPQRNRWNCVTAGSWVQTIFGTGDSDVWVAHSFQDEATILHKGP